MFEKFRPLADRVLVKRLEIEEKLLAVFLFLKQQKKKRKQVKWLRLVKGVRIRTVTLSLWILTLTILFFLVNMRGLRRIKTI